MEDMIARIVEMDKKARDITEEAQKNKLDYENQVIAKREGMKNEYLGRAKKRISINEESARKKAERSIRQMEERNNAVIRRMDSTYAQNRDQWINEIVTRTIGEQA